MKELFQEYKKIILIVFICFALIFICNIVSSVFDKGISEADASLSKINNKIETMKAKEKDTKEVAYTVNDEYAKKYLEENDIPLIVDTRKQLDDAFAKEYIKYAFDFSNARQYKAHRDEYIRRLGINHPLVIDILPPYEASYEYANDGTGNVVDGYNIHSHLDSNDGFTTYLMSVNSDGSYNYLAILKHEANGIKMPNNIALTYTVKPIYNSDGTPKMVDMTKYVFDDDGMPVLNDDGSWKRESIVSKYTKEIKDDEGNPVLDEEGKPKTEQVEEVIQVQERTILGLHAFTPHL